MRTGTDGIWPSVVAGAVGGLVAAGAMNQFQSALSAIAESMARKERERQGQPEPQKESTPSGDDATVKAAEAISSSVFHHKLQDDEKQWAGPAVHYGLGTTLGAVYGALAPCTPAIEAGAGTGFGAAVWLGADEISVPLFGLSGPPTDTPLSGHIKGLAAHLVFGLVTHLCRKLVLS